VARGPSRIDSLKITGPWKYKKKFKVPNEKWKIKSSDEQERN